MKYDNVLPFDPVGRGGMARRGAPDKNTSPPLARDLPPAASPASGSRGCALDRSPDPSLAAAPAARGVLRCARGDSSRRE